MKPFTTTEVMADGRTHLRAKFDGLEPGRLLESLQRAEVVGCQIPADQTPELAWLAVLALDSGAFLEITSSSTLVKGWAEFGTINLALTRAQAKGVAESDIAGLEGFVIDQISIVQWRGDDVLADAGIEFSTAEGTTFSAVAIDIPGAFSMSFPGGPRREAWQFPAGEYVRIGLKDYVDLHSRGAMS